MRLWSLHPSLLDRQGLVACWREALLAQAVLRGRTRGYTRHPQLQRFQVHPEPHAAIAEYLEGLLQESRQRGYRFSAEKIEHPHLAAAAEGRAEREQSSVELIPVTTGQLALEWEHLRGKLVQRSPAWLAEELPEHSLSAHPLFVVVPGEAELWERAEPR